MLGMDKIDDHVQSSTPGVASRRWSANTRRDLRTKGFVSLFPLQWIVLNDLRELAARAWADGKRELVWRRRCEDEEGGACSLFSP